LGVGGVRGNGGLVISGGNTGRTAVASGGTTNFGGQLGATGGEATRGGTPGTGGTRPASGSSATGGAQPTGGSVATGGAQPTGGSVATGGAQPTGGSVATGGAQPTGGSVATGGNGMTNPGPIALNCPGAIPTGIVANWCSCEQWGEWVNGTATFYNDIWGSGAGKQCIWINQSNQFGVVAAHPSGGSVKSYPNISYSPGNAISAINTYSSSFEVAVPSSGVWETTYDLWVKNGNNPRIEIMLWMNKAGGSQPIARSYAAGGAVADNTNVNVGGHTWNVYTGSNGANHVVSLLRTANTNSGSVDVKAILNWIITNEKSFNSSWTLDQVQFGFEIVSDSGTESFTAKSFSVLSS